jgi:AraC-like DNA-binding protein
MYIIGKPSQDLSPLIEYYWELHVDSASSPFSEYIFSYPFNNLVINLQESYNSVDSISGQVSVASDKFIGNRIFPVSYIHASGNSVFGVKFVLGGAYPFINKSGWLTNNLLLDVDEILQQDQMRALTTLKRLPDFQKRVERVEDILRSMIDKERQKLLQGVSSWFERVLIMNDYNCSISALSEKANVSVKTLERRSYEVFGAHPKQIISAVRCRAATREIEKTGVLSDCLQFGYWDQNHYIKEVKKFTGQTPTSLLKRINRTQ